MARISAPLRLPYAVSPPSALTTNVQAARSLREVGAMRAGTLTDNQPVDVLTQTVGGALIYSYTEQFYNWLYVIPDKLEVPAVDGQAVFAVQLWNAYRRTPATLTSTLVTLDGVTLSGLPNGTVLQPLGLYDLTVLISEDGPAVINGSVNFTLNGGATPGNSLPITGSRTSPVVYKPNWRDGVERTYSFLTDLFVSSRGLERRNAIRREPRVILRYTHLATKAEATKLRRWMGRSAFKRVLIPDWPTRSTIAETTSGSLSFVMSAVPAWVIADAQLFVTDKANANAELVIVQSVVGNTVNLKGPVAIARAGAYVYRSVSARARDLSMSQITDSVVETQFTFDYEPGFEAFATRAPAGATLKGREVFPFKPNWRGDIPVEFHRLAQAFDTGYGRRAESYYTKAATRLWQYNFLGRTYAEIGELEEFFRRQDGRRAEFWASTFVSDMTIQSATAGLDTITVDEEIFAELEGDESYRAIEVETNLGTRARFYIESWVDTTPGVTTLTLDQPWPVGLVNEGVKRVSWLMLCRFASDDLNVQYQTDGVAEVALTLQSLIVEPQE